ncbi:hypothetical protein AXF42_Ash001454 [Apostasia shenzhenica]|uniref:Uncharacterized protein n=1 Tax=Apostasia shenzhenica TaxID=1088818 RepID=A0A2I0AUZ3_9ASPA|nr:hypothetical protein AXF42_Ash001454 [Apostasia shenzhenica]
MSGAAKHQAQTGARIASHGRISGRRGLLAPQPKRASKVRCADLRMLWGCRSDFLKVYLAFRTFGTASRGLCCRVFDGTPEQMRGYRGTPTCLQATAREYCRNAMGLVLRR